MSKELLSSALKPVKVKEAAQSKLEFQSVVSPDGFASMQELLFKNAEDSQTTIENFSVNLTANFSQNINNVPELELQLSGQLIVVCQRCMGSMQIDIQQDENYLLVKSQQHAEQLEMNTQEIIILDEQESQIELRDGELDLNALAIEELLLSISFYPKHIDDFSCKKSNFALIDDYVRGESQVTREELNDVQMQEVEKDVQRPFANLKDLIKH